jgi:hypothetical protein
VQSDTAESAPQVGMFGAPFGGPFILPLSAPLSVTFTPSERGWFGERERKKKKKGPFQGHSNFIIEQNLLLKK